MCEKDERRGRPRASPLPWIPAFAGTTLGVWGPVSAAGGGGGGSRCGGTALREPQGDRIREAPLRWGVGVGEAMGVWGGGAPPGACLGKGFHRNDACGRPPSCALSNCYGWQGGGGSRGSGGGRWLRSLCMQATSATFLGLPWDVEGPDDRIGAQGRWACRGRCARGRARPNTAGRGVGRCRGRGARTDGLREWPLPRAPCATGWPTRRVISRSRSANSASGRRPSARCGSRQRSGPCGGEAPLRWGVGVGEAMGVWGGGAPPGACLGKGFHRNDACGRPPSCALRTGFDRLRANGIANGPCDGVCRVRSASKSDMGGGGSGPARPCPAGPAAPRSPFDFPQGERPPRPRPSGFLPSPVRRWGVGVGEAMGVWVRPSERAMLGAAWVASDSVGSEGY